MHNEYTKEELNKLHAYLYKILAEIIRVCNKLNIPYFIQGGTAIGAYFYEGIIPWDDDIDIGMTRENYKKFLKEAPAVLSDEYFLQWIGTDHDTPFYFAKVRLNGTTFAERPFRKMNIHHGIYIDVFPFDKVPDNLFVQRIHRSICNFLNGCFMGKSIWQWKYCGKCGIDTPRNRGFLPCLITRVVDSLFSKESIFHALSYMQGIFNNTQTKYYNMVLMPKDHISVKSIDTPQIVKFGDLHVTAPSDLKTYLHHHYGNVKKDIPKEQQRNHRPAYLSFTEELSLND